jgi:hypothetical protein
MRFILRGSFMRLHAAVLSLCLVATAAAADPVGQFAVAGTNPGGGSGYSGVVNVERTGDTYRVVWNVGGQRYNGTGIGNDEFIAVSYRSGDSTGLALYRATGGGWEGIWTYAGSRQIGTERWTPR